MAQAAQGGRAEVVLHYRRPSAILASAKGLDATLVAYDDRGVVGISGSAKDVETARQYLRLADVPRKTLLVRVTVTSPVDHLTWEVDARLTSGQRWRTADDETGAEIALEPRVDGDGSLNVTLVARCRGEDLASRMRLAKGEAKTLAMGAKGVQDVEVGPGDRLSVAGSHVALPTITVRYVGG